MLPPVDLWQYELRAQTAGHTRVAGLDEVGRGPLAGPVVAACVVLPEGFSLDGINDSKKLTERGRERAEARIRAEAVAIGLGIVEPETIDRINILQASRQAMREAFLSLDAPPDCVLIDGLPIPAFPCAHQQAIVGGDGLCASIAAASIVAKVARDRMMRAYHDVYPEYGFAGHKGYGAAKHLEALRVHGPCPIHRRSFAPVAACFGRPSADE
jgi:ribonuclease HII